MVECQRRGDVDIVAVLPPLELARVDTYAVAAHASAKSYAVQAARTAVWTSARAKQTFVFPLCGFSLAITLL